MGDRPVHELDKIRGSTPQHDRFQDIFQRFYWRIVRYFMRAFRVSEEDAEDLAQETFRKFYESMDEYRGDAEWAFLETTARNVALNRIRAVKAKKRNVSLVSLDDPDVSPILPAAPAGPAYEVRESATLRRDRLYTAIRGLPPGQKQCLHLWLEDLDYEGIAGALRITVDAVKSRLRDAKRTLRKRLGEGPTSEDAS